MLASCGILTLSTNCTVMDVYEADCFATGPHQFEFQIYASHFLRGFMRVMIHTLCEVGAGNLSLEAFKERIESGQSPQLI
jgi:tRNA U38,U39,U40 pseudouridine synthase TruA